MSQIILHDFDDVLDEFYGPKGTPRRDEHEQMVAQEVNASRMNFTSASALAGEVWGNPWTPGREAMQARLSEEVQNYQIGEAVRRAQSQNSNHEQRSQI